MLSKRHVMTHLHYRRGNKQGPTFDCPEQTSVHYFVTDEFSFPLSTSVSHFEHCMGLWLIQYFVELH